MKKTVTEHKNSLRRALGALVAVSALISAQNAWATSLVVDASTMTSDEGQNTTGVQPRDGGPGISPWINSTSASWPGEATVDAFSDASRNNNNLTMYKDPAVILDDNRQMGASSAPTGIFNGGLIATPNQWNPNGPATTNGGHTNNPDDQTGNSFSSNVPNVGDGRQILVTPGNNTSTTGGPNFYHTENQFSAVDGTTMYMESKFRVYGGNNMGGALLSLGVAHGPALALMVNFHTYDHGTGAGQQAHQFELWKFHGDSSAQSIPGLGPQQTTGAQMTALGNLQTTDAAHNANIGTPLGNQDSGNTGGGDFKTTGNGGSSDFAWHESAYHQLDMAITRSIADVMGHAKVYWDGSLVYDQDIAPWSNSGPAFFDSNWNGQSTWASFGDGNVYTFFPNSSARFNPGFSYVQVTDTASALPVGSPFNAVPEPSTFVLAGLALVGLVSYARRRKA